MKLFSYDHVPLDFYQKFEIKKAVIMLRKPSQRIISGFHAGLHANGMKAKMRQRMYETVKTPAEYANFPGIAGCETKMVSIICF